MEQLELLPERVSRHAREAPGDCAIRDDVEALTWADLDRCVSESAAALQGAGVERGDRVAFLGENSARYAASLYGVLRLGAVAAPLSGFLDAGSLAGLIFNSGARAIVASAGYREIVEASIELLPDAVKPVRLALDFADPRWTPAFVSARAPHWPPPEHASTGVVIYSSGTTGMPKGVVHSHGLRALQAKGFADDIMTPSTVTLLSTPMCSNWTLTGLFAAGWARAPVVFMRRFTEQDFFDHVRRDKPLLAFLVPTQLERLLDDPEFDAAISGASMMKLCAGAPLSAQRKREAVARWPGLLVEVYGATEGALTTKLVANDYPDKLESVGKPGQDFFVAVLDEAGEEAPPGEIGELAGSSPYMMAGYFGREDLTADITWRDRQGRVYLRTGDLGRVDSDGFVFIAGRAKDMIISGGQNVYPLDIEGVLALHPDISEAAVIGLPSKKWGETPFAVVVRSSEELDEASLLAWANPRLAKHQRLSGAAFVGVLPRGSLDKVLKKTLLANFAHIEFP